MDSFIIFSEEVAKKYGLDDRKSVMMVRCATALMIFEDDSDPEVIEVINLLKTDSVLSEATKEFLQKLMDEEKKGKSS